LPASATTGLSFSALVDVPAYPAPEWVLLAYVRGPKSINLEATASGSAHQFSAPAATTSEWTPGDYWYSLRATNGDEAVEIETGTLRVLPDLMAAGDGYDGRSQAQIALDAINAVLEKRASLDQERYRINNRELYRTPIAELLKLRAHYVELCRAEDAEAAGGRKLFGKQVKIRMGASS